jgi:hypothetical protein
MQSSQSQRAFKVTILELDGNISIDMFNKAFDKVYKSICGYTSEIDHAKNRRKQIFNRLADEVSLEELAVAGLFRFCDDTDCVRELSKIKKLWYEFRQRMCDTGVDTYLYIIRFALNTILEPIQTFFQIFCQEHKNCSYICYNILKSIGKFIIVSIFILPASIIFLLVFVLAFIVYKSIDLLHSLFWRNKYTNLLGIVNTSQSAFYEEVNKLIALIVLSLSISQLVITFITDNEDVLDKAQNILTALTIAGNTLLLTWGLVLKDIKRTTDEIELTVKEVLLALQSMHYEENASPQKDLHIYAQMLCSLMQHRIVRLVMTNKTDTWKDINWMEVYDGMSAEIYTGQEVVSKTRTLTMYPHRPYMSSKKNMERFQVYNARIYEDESSEDKPNHNMSNMLVVKRTYNKRFKSMFDYLAKLYKKLSENSTTEISYEITNKKIGKYTIGTVYNTTEVNYDIAAIFIAAFSDTPVRAILDQCEFNIIPPNTNTDKLLVIAQNVMLAQLDDKRKLIKIAARKKNEPLLLTYKNNDIFANVIRQQDTKQTNENTEQTNENTEQTNEDTALPIN